MPKKKNVVIAEEATKDGPADEVVVGAAAGPSCSTDTKDEEVVAVEPLEGDRLTSSVRTSCRNKRYTVLSGNILQHRSEPV